MNILILNGSPHPMVQLHSFVPHSKQVHYLFQTVIILKMPKNQAPLFHSSIAQNI